MEATTAVIAISAPSFIMKWHENQENPSYFGGHGDGHFVVGPGVQPLQPDLVGLSDGVDDDHGGGAGGARVVLIHRAIGHLVPGYQPGTVQALQVPPEK